MDDCLTKLESLLQIYPYPDDLQVRARVIYDRYIIAAIWTNDPDTELDEAMIGLLHKPIPADQKVAYATMVVFRICWLEQGRERCEQIRSIIQQIIKNEAVSPMERFVWNLSGIIFDFIFVDLPLSNSKSLAEAVSIGKRHGFEMLQQTCQIVITQSLCIEGRGKEALARLQPLLSYVSQLNKNNYSHIQLVAAHCYILNDQAGAAQDFAKQSLQTAKLLNSNSQAQSLLALSLTAIELGNRAEALLNLAFARRLCRINLNQHLEFSVRILLAYCALQSQNRNRAEFIFAT